MPFTKVTAAGIESSANFIAQNLNVTGVITASNGIQGIGIQSGRLNVTTGIITALNFIGAGNTIVYNSSTRTVDISIGSGNWAFLDELNTNTSNIYRLNGNVGIGTTNASSTFTVRGNSLITGVSTFQGISTFQSNVNIAGTVAIGTAINIIPYNNLNSGTLSFEGSAGQLFSITNNLTSGSIFSVNDVSGIPSIDVDAAGVVELVPFNGRVGVGTTNPSASYKFDVAGNGRFSQDIVVNSVNIGCGGISTTNVIVGAGAGTSGPGSENVFVGAGAGRSVTSAAYRNTAIGYQAMYNNDIGPTNTAIGWQALYSLNGYTYYNTAVGRYALGALTSGIQNIAMGHNAGGSVTTGSGNVCINSGGPTTGSSNVWISGAGSTAGSSNILIGGNITASTGTESYNVMLGGGTVSGGINNNIIIGDGQGNERIRVISNGNVGIGITNPSSILNVGSQTLGTSTDNKIILAGRQTGSIGTFASFYFKNSQDSGGSSASIRALRVSDNYGTELAFFTQNSGGASGGDGVEAVRINRGGLVGIGTDNPQAKLHLSSNTSTQLLISNTSSTMNSGDTMGTVDFTAGPSNTTNARVSGLVVGTNESGGNVVFETRADGGSLAERARFNSTGAFVLAGGNTSANGIGIAFPSTQSASTDANTLDDYEEGTFTPIFIGTTTNPTVGYSEQFGRYVKIGRTCFVVIRIVTSSVSSGSGEVRISGLPFTASNDTSFSGTMAPGFIYNWSTNPKVFFVLNGSTHIVMYSNDATNTISQVSHLNTAAASANYVNISGYYPTL